MAELADAKAALESLHKEFEEFKKVNEKRIEALKAEKSTTDFDEKLDRINDALSKQEKVQREFLRQQEAVERKRQLEEEEWKAKQAEQDRRIEARVNRAVLGLGNPGAEENLAEERLSAKTYGHFLRRGFEQLSADERKVLTASNDTTGGYLAPSQYAADIIKAAVLFSPMRGLVNVVNIGTGKYEQPKRTGTAAATRNAESGTRAETTNPAYGLIAITAPEMYAEARISLQNLEDSAFNLEAELAQEFAEQFGVKEGAEVISGTGNANNQCLGILDANAAGLAVPIAYTASGATSTIAGASGLEAKGLIDLFHAVKTPYAVRGTWIMNRGSLGKVRSLKDTTGQYLWQLGIAPSSPNTILGAPYVECPDMPDEGTNAFPVAFGDFKRAYTLVQRVEMSIMRDPYTLASSGQVKFTARRRVGGQVVLGEAIRLLKCATS